MPAVLKPFLITFAACLAIHMWPGGIFLWAVIWGIALLLAGAYMGLGQLLALAGSNFLFLLLLGDNGLAVDLLIFYTIPVITAAVLLKRKRSYYSVLGAAMLAAVVSVLLYMGISYGYLGNEGIANVKAGINQAADSSLA